MTRTGPSGPSASTDGLGGGESLRQAPFLVDISLFGAAVMFFSSSSGLPIFPWDQELVYCMFDTSKPAHLPLALVEIHPSDASL